MTKMKILSVFLFGVQCLAAQIQNDECTTAIPITTLPFQISQNTRLASENNTDPALTCQDSITNGRTVWFKYTADTTRFIVFNTIGSQPAADYDVIMALFTGSCGNFVQVACNDDTLDTRQSVIGFTVAAGTTYYLMIGEWGGGGTWGGVPTGGDLELNVYVPILPPLVRGPKFGTLSSGVILSTDYFHSVMEMPASRPKLRKPNINKRIKKLPPPPNMKLPAGPYGSNYFEDSSQPSNRFSSDSLISRPVVMQNFEGIPQTNFIPPDPIVAVGPDHLMIAVNSTFRIFDKTGTILKTIDADEWFDQVIPGASTFDPIVHYDHFDKRWIFEMLHVDDLHQKAYILLAVSDDENPLGTWRAWGIPAHQLGDSSVQHWSDYARIGFDENAIYITSHEFGFTSDFAYSKLRILPKAPIYSTSSPSISWIDFWDFRDPDNRQNVIFGLRPSIVFGNPGKEFLLNDSPYFLGTFFTLWSVDSIHTTPVITAENIPVVQYFGAPDAGQREGGSIPLEALGADIRNEPVYKDSSLWLVHAVASGPNKEYSSVRYVKFDPFKKQPLEDVVFGLPGFWHSYPALMVNNEGSLTITYSRSGIDEYIGAFMTGRKKNDPAGLAPSILIREGRGNYVVDYGSGRNRWGDYNGISVDPSDGNSIWTHTEFAAEKNKWGTWIAKSVMGPVPGTKLTVDKSFLQFGTVNVGGKSDTIVMTLANDGLDTLFISSLQFSTNHFQIFNNNTFPISIPSLRNVELNIIFTPQSSGSFNDSIVYTMFSSGSTFLTLAHVRGTGFQIIPAKLGTLYAGSGSVDGGKLYTINTSNGEHVFLSNSGLPQIGTIRVHPKSKELIALDPTGSGDGGAFYRISVSGTSLQKLSEFKITNTKGVAFIDDSLAYIADFNGRIYRINIFTGVSVQIASTGYRIGGLAVNPVNGTLWFCLRATLGAVDGIYQYHTGSNSVRLVGQTGLGIANADLLFDKNGSLYVLAGLQTAQNSIMLVDTTDASVQKIFPLQKSNITSIALNPDAVAGLESIASRQPHRFTLAQNYPNPFNPLTVIEYSIPQPGVVTLTVYDVLGRVVQRLAQGWRNAGSHHEYFDVTGLSSGVYYYRLTAGEMSATRKMTAVK